MGFWDQLFSQDSVDNTLNLIWSAMKEFFERVKEFVKVVIEGVLDFVNEVVAWFKNLNLVKGVHIPFIADIANEKFRQMLGEAQIKNIGIFEGVYNRETEEIESGRVVEADALDQKTKDTLDDSGLTVLG